MRIAALVLALLASRGAGAVTVTTTADAGPGSLRQVLADATDGTSIDFAVPTPATITLGGGELTIARSVTIAGPGAAALTINAHGASRTLHVLPGATVALSGLTLTGGSTLQGGGCLWNENGTVTLTRVVVTQCEARYGGGILNDGEVAPATMQLVESTVTGNQAVSASGAGIYNDGSEPGGSATLEVVGTTISDNAAPMGGRSRRSCRRPAARRGTASWSVSGRASTTSGRASRARRAPAPSHPH